MTRSAASVRFGQDPAVPTAPSTLCPLPSQPPPSPPARAPCAGVPASQQWWLSCTTQAGLNDFLGALSGLVKDRYGASDGEPALITRARHREHVSAAVDALDAFERLAAQGEAAPLDLAAEELRTAANELGRISGRVDVEELLDVIFRDFCIGK
eukprot:Transcript_4895.p2 GENE.Transcript_4895~~Transcript_4895.p2  ORF type:complete len:154 (+),score=60.16 Transcript_4895:754-1215(+)